MNMHTIISFLAGAISAGIIVWGASRVTIDKLHHKYFMLEIKYDGLLSQYQILNSIVQAKSKTNNQDKHYRVLGLSRDASALEIKSKYRQLIKKYHPDVNKTKEAANKFKEIQEAYAVIKDGNKYQ